MKKHAHRARRKASTLHLLHRAGLSADELFSFFVGFDGPSARQHAILLAVARNGGASQAAIVQDTGIDRSTTSAMAVRLVRKGWLRRRPDRNDGRAYVLRLTAAGRKVVRAGERAASEAEASMLAQLSSRRRTVFRKGLSAILRAYGN